MNQYRECSVLRSRYFFTDEDAQIFTEIYVAKSGVKAAQNIAKRYSF